MDGIIVLNKPKGMTSFDCVHHIKKHFHLKRVGHTGTLDPLATGILVICLDEACKAIEFMENDTKTYDVVIRFGIKTDTFDITGNVLEIKEEFLLSNDILDNALPRFRGAIKQTPPVFSAIKKDGKPLYYYARKGIEVEIKERDAFVYSFERLSDVYQIDNIYYCNFRLKVSKGTYIRSIVNDLGEYLSFGATMQELNRIQCGMFKKEDCVELDDIDNDNFHMYSIIDALNYPQIDITNDLDLQKRVNNGMKVYDLELINNFNEKDRFLLVNNKKVNAVYELRLIDDKKCLVPLKVWIR